jgi:2,3-bisphosphoglycerate-dependent phosphoglycerate mutase
MGCDRTWKMRIPNTAFFEFWIDRDRWSDSGMSRGISDLWQIKQFGDIPHLADEPYLASRSSSTGTS